MSFFAEKIRKNHHSFCTVVVVAAGDSARMGEDKLCLPIGGVPVLARTLTALNSCETVDEIIVVTQARKLNWVGELKKEYGIGKLHKAVIGGSIRTASALAGVSEASKAAKIICIHDGDRPFVTREIVADTVHYAILHLAAAPAVAVKSTVKLRSGDFVNATLDRDSLAEIQTPQAFQADVIKAALTKAVQENAAYPDDCAAAEALGVKAFLCRGSEENIKITTPADLTLAEAILKRLGGRPV